MKADFYDLNLIENEKCVPIFSPSMQAIHFYFESYLYCNLFHYLLLCMVAYKWVVLWLKILQPLVFVKKTRQEKKVFVAKLRRQMLFNVQILTVV